MCAYMCGGCLHFRVEAFWLFFCAASVNGCTYWRESLAEKQKQAYYKGLFSTVNSFSRKFSSWYFPQWGRENWCPFRHSVKKKKERMKTLSVISFLYSICIFLIQWKYVYLNCCDCWFLTMFNKAVFKKMAGLLMWKHATKDFPFWNSHYFKFGCITSHFIFLIFQMLFHLGTFQLYFPWSCYHKEQYTNR